MADIPDNLTASQRITFACPKCGHMIVRMVGTLYHSTEIVCSECIGRWDGTVIREELESMRGVDSEGPPTVIDVDF